jgi:hypothetical protein
MSHRYTVITDPSGCRIVEGESIPMGDAGALLTAWAERGDESDPVVCDMRLPKILTARSASKVVLVVGRKSELDALAGRIGGVE